MKIEKEELTAILGQFNPWWRQESIQDLPDWQRASFGELLNWVISPPAARAIFLSGARQVGKTTLLMQVIDKLIKSGVPSENILYATFDHPILKLAGIEAVLDAWNERVSKKEGLEYIFLDEAQFIRDWGTWVKHQVDFFKNRRIIFTGSAMPLLQDPQESGVGRWHTIRLTTLSFYEYVQLKKINGLPKLPQVNTLKDVFLWHPSELSRVSELALAYISHFHEYLVRGGFPQTTLVETISQAQKLLREDIVDKALKRDMTVLFGVRRILDLEQTFLYLCRHDGGILDMTALCSALGVKRPTAQHFIDLLEATHLIYRLQPYGYGKEVLRGRYKIYLADAAIAPAVMLKGRAALEDPDTLGIAAEAAVLRHLYARYYQQNVLFTYWRGKKDIEVDLVAQVNGQVIPFEVKYRSREIDSSMVSGLKTFCAEKKADRGYVITKSCNDFGLLFQKSQEDPKIFKIPAVLLCYWMGESEVYHHKVIE